MRRRDREITEMEEIINILEKCKTADIAMIDAGRPYVIPLSYGYEVVKNQLILYFHSAREGRKIEILKHNNSVCFSIYKEGNPVYEKIPCNSGYYFLSVIGNGVVEFIEEPAEKQKALSKMFAHQAGREVSFDEKQAETVCVFKVVSTDFTGKQVRNRA